MVVWSCPSPCIEEYRSSVPEEGREIVVLSQPLSYSREAPIHSRSEVATKSKAMIVPDAFSISGLPSRAFGSMRSCDD